MSISLEIMSYLTVETQKSAKQRQISSSVLHPTSALDGKKNPSVWVRGSVQINYVLLYYVLSYGILSSRRDLVRLSTPDVWQSCTVLRTQKAAGGRRRTAAHAADPGRTCIPRNPEAILQHRSRTCQHILPQSSFYMMVGSQIQLVALARNSELYH